MPLHRRRVSISERGLDFVARSVCTHPRLILGATVLLLALAAAFGDGVSGYLHNGASEDRSSESSYATRLLERDFPHSRANLVLMVSAERGVDHPLVARQGSALSAQLAKERGVVGVTSYWTMRAMDLRGKHGREALIGARLSGDETDAAQTLERIAPRYRGARGALVIRLGGAAAIRHETEVMISEDLARAEAVALPITLLILVFAFGSGVAALLPVCVGVIAVVGANAVLRGLAATTEVSVFALNLTTALSLGLAIDYGLLIVRRYREELAGGTDMRTAVNSTVKTAGRTVAFSAATVAVALATLLVFPLSFLRSMAYAGISVVLLCAVASLVVLPALLCVLGPRIDALDMRALLRRGKGRHAAPRQGAGWARLTTVVIRRAPFFAVGTLGVLVLLGLPFLGVEFGTADDRQLPDGAEARIVQQHIRDGFTGNATGGIEVVTPQATATDLTEYTRRISTLRGVTRVDGPTGQYTAGARTGPGDPTRVAAKSSWLTVVTHTDDSAGESENLVRTVRGIEAPFSAYAGGAAPASVDSRAAIADHLPVAATLISTATLALVLMLTGSLLVALQAVLLNALSLTAMLGAIVWVFQDGHLSGPLGFTATGWIEASLPVLMFCMAFGLSMDYGVFLLSRIREELLRTGDHRRAVVEGMRHTGGIITAAALILAVVLVSVGMSRTAGTKMLGLGVALAVLVDALVVRTLLVPAVLTLTGRATWWSPVTLRPSRRSAQVNSNPPTQTTGDSPLAETTQPLPERQAHARHQSKE
ncbi:MMPL family transporter [Streptomyces sp. NBC_00879]|uniref:MMPL family transporter n=1 Tax=Streptomyces sp. NBC_00879 TaxID=2975855 RepID=UPI00386784B7|nr:MMPL family transporter [Streptomyces sp. NBC_00879]